MMPRRATTDGDGQFEFAALPAGRPRILRISRAVPSFAVSFHVVRATRPASMYWGEPGQSIELKDGEALRQGRYCPAPRRNHHRPRHR